MAVDFKQSKTKENLLRAFAGESQARNRYTFAAYEAHQQKVYVVEKLFKFTADQEREHAEVFYNQLKEVAGENIEIDGSYPVDLSKNLAELLRMAQHNEYEEHDDVYQNFANTAKEEGFPKAANSFSLIAGVEKMHGDRFGAFAKLLEDGELFVSKIETKWICLKCGYVIESKSAPQTCTSCGHEQGWFVRLELAPFCREGEYENLV